MSGSAIGDAASSGFSSKGTPLQMPIMDNAMKYINPYYTRQQPQQGLSPLAAFHAFRQGQPMPRPQGQFQQFMPSRMPTLSLNNGTPQPASQAALSGGGYVNNSGMGGGFGGGFGGMAGSPGGPSGTSAGPADGIGVGSTSGINGMDAMSDAAMGMGGDAGPATGGPNGNDGSGVTGGDATSSSDGGGGGGGSGGK